MTKSRRTPFAYGIVLALGVASALFLLSLDETMSVYSDFAYRRSLSDGSLYSVKDVAKYSNLQAAADIDPSIESRALVNDAPDRCSRLFLFLPDPFADHGHGSQINTYIMGITASTYLDRAMVLLEPPIDESRYAGGSQFGCPVDAFHETMTKTSRNSGTASWGVREDFPLGFSRLVQQPAWLSRGCEVPTCGEASSYKDWVNLARGKLQELACVNSDGTEANVVVTGGGGLRAHFRENDALMTRNHPSPQATRWAVNLGATPREAELFSNTKESRLVWDYVLGLMNKAGFLKFQPWIARDVKLFLKSFDLPLDGEYDAIHVRRGDKLVKEARSEVIRYWRSQGHADTENLPTDYVPFAHYLSQYGTDECKKDENGKVRINSHNVYIATDDPVVVHEEIAALPNRIDEDTVLWNDCHQLTFYFSPTDGDSFHLNGDGEDGFTDEHKAEGGDNCFSRYHRNIVSIADMMILSKARTFVGEYNSNWGRVIRTMRVRLNVPVGQGDGDAESGATVRVMQGRKSLTRTLDTRIAWGATIARTPGY